MTKNVHHKFWRIKAEFSLDKRSTGKLFPRHLKDVVKQEKSEVGGNASLSLRGWTPLPRAFNNTYTGVCKHMQCIQVYYTCISGCHLQLHHLLPRGPLTREALCRTDI